jgi:hypothetical protein
VNHAIDAVAELRNVISLADYRKPVTSSDHERPPPAPGPMAARIPAIANPADAIASPRSPLIVAA